MGHFEATISGTGSDWRDARANAVSEFEYAHGHDCSITKFLAARLVEKVPPKKQVTRTVCRLGHGLGAQSYVYEETVMESDPSAPEQEWLEHWEFDIDYHA